MIYSYLQEIISYPCLGATVIRENYEFKKNLFFARVSDIKLS